MNKWNLIIDVALCHDCNNCFLSCKDEHCENDFLPYSSAQPRHGHRWIDILRKERGQYPMVDVGYLPVPCMHCEAAPCMSGSEGDPVYRRDDGIVLIDPVKAKGRKDLTDSCPYGAIWWNEESAIPQKCTFCAHLLDDGWEQPRCVQVCPTGAMRFVSLSASEMEALRQSEALEVYQPQFDTEPLVHYKNLYRYTKCFIGGTVALRDVGDCADGAEVTLRNGAGEVVDTARTNNYGDFRIDGLEPNSGRYDLKVSYAGYGTAETQVELADSVNIGVVQLQPIAT